MTDGPKGEHITERLTNEAIDFIDANRSVPFFVYLALRAVHRPMTARPDLEEKYRHKQASDPARFEGYAPDLAASLEAADIGIGRILARLDELGLSDDTVVFFTSDHGAAMRSTDGELRGHKGMLFEGGIRVPLIVRWPGVTPASSTTDIPVSFVDIYPTLVEIAGAPVRHDQEPDGASLVPVFQGDPFDRDRPIFWHFPLYLGGGSNDPVYPWSPRTMRATPASAVRIGDWKLLNFAEGNHVELYNLRSDIGERNDLAASEPDRTRAMLRQLEEWRLDTRAFVPSQANPAYVPPSGRTQPSS